MASRIPRSAQLVEAGGVNGRKKCRMPDKLFTNVTELVKPMAKHVLQAIKFEMEYVGWSRRIMVNTKRQATEMPITLPKRISESVMKYHSGSADVSFAKAILTRTEDFLLWKLFFFSVLIEIARDELV